jgi:flagellar protein FliL
VAEAKTKKSGGSGLPIALVMITLVAGGAGAGLGLVLPKPDPAGKSAPPAKPESDAPKDHGAPHSSGDHGAGASHAQGKATKSAPPAIIGKTKLRELATITTNLNGPKAPWIRLEGSLIYDETIEQEISVLSTKITEDFVTYLRSVHLSQIEGSGGLQALVEDLNERARTRSSGKVHQFIVSGFILE